MNLSVTHRGAYAPPVEFVERKGLGHPDTICDALAEDLARRLASDYLTHTGNVQAFNVDKAILAAGSVAVDYGGGEHLTPAKLVLVGKANFSTHWQPDVDALAPQYKKKLMELLPDADPDAFNVEIWLSQSSADLAAVVTHSDEAPLSNDTSFAAVSLPRSPLERAVHAVEHHLNSEEYRSAVPVGRDIKVMGARVGLEARLTVAAPIMAKAVSNRSEYDEAVNAIQGTATDVAADAFGSPVEVFVNQGDQDDSAYLTLSGTSAEAGDDGQVGRGNRFGGLITPYRPMSLEAAAGKNPAAHVGKTYHAIGADISDRLIREMDVDEVTIRLLSSIGHPVTSPQAVHIDMAGGPVDDVALLKTVEEAFEDWSGVRDRLIAGEYELY
jgi:S-adenosylmethionine synthetase